MIQVDEIKRLKDEENLSFREISRRTGLNRRTIRKWYFSKDYPKYQRKKQLSKSKEKILPYLKIWLEEDINLIKKRKIRKIRPASAMWQSLKDMGIRVSESTVRNLVREIKPKEVFIPLQFDPGDAMQVDWAELKLEIENKEIKVKLFVASLPFSNARFIYPYLKADQISFFDGHVKAFKYFGGIAKRLIYDNLKSAVKKVLRGKNRQETDGMLYFKNYYSFETEYCAPGKGNEKGSVEKAVDFFKRRYLSSKRSFKDFNELKAYLSACLHEILENRHYKNKSDKIIDLLELERKYFNPLPKTIFQASLWKELRSNKSSLISYDGVSYSIPADYSQRLLQIKVMAEEIAIFHNNKEIARHKRSHHLLNKDILDFRHYLPVLLKKSRAFDQAKCIKKNPFPTCFWDYLAGLKKHQLNGNREMVRILLLEKLYPLKDIFFAMEWALAHKSFSYDIICMILADLKMDRPKIEVISKTYPTIQEKPCNN